MDELLQLCRVPHGDGTLYLYPEYVDIAGQFDLGVEGEVLSGGTRKPRLVRPTNGTPYVVKDERPFDDVFRVVASHFGHAIPRNLSACEVSIARVLSHLAGYEDDDTKIAFEEPFGFYQNAFGERSSLFRYQEGLTKLKFPPVPITIDDTQGHFFLDDPFDLGRLSQRAANLPRSFCLVHLLHNGLSHNESKDDFAALLPIGGKVGLYVMDFEFCMILNAQKREKRLDSELYEHLWLERLYVRSAHREKAEEQWHSLGAAQRRVEILEQIARAAPPRLFVPYADRIRQYLAPSGYLAGETLTQTAAFEALQRVRRLSLDDALI